MSTHDHADAPRARDRPAQLEQRIRAATCCAPGRGVDDRVLAQRAAAGDWHGRRVYGLSGLKSAVDAAVDALADAGRLAGEPYEPDEPVEDVLAAFNAAAKGVTRRPPARAVAMARLARLLGGFDVTATLVEGRALLSMRCHRHRVPRVLVPATGIRREGGMCQKHLDLGHLLDMAARHEREHHAPEGGLDVA